MTKTSWLFFIALWAMPILLSAQSQEQCGTMDLLLQEVQANPKRLNQLDHLERQIQQRLSQRHAADSSVIVIPVVFHIVHNGEPIGTGPNISDAQVISQLDVLNEDFRRTNPDTANTPAVFKAVAADTKIEFCLATQAPDGSVSTGINRVNGGQANWSNGDIQNTLKPNTVWDSDKYLNFWVVNFSNSSLLGYAQFPGGNKQTDGVVVGYPYVGRPPHNPFNNNYNGGRTGTHEVGHWLNLRHIWGDGPCSQDDFVDDTPLSDASNSGCPSTNSCTDTPIDHPDMVENYMDYTRDDCMNIFTIGQGDRMRAAIQASRPQLINQPLACTPLNTFAYTGRIIDSLSGKGVAGAVVQLAGFFKYTVTTDTGGYFDLPNLYGDTYSIYAGKWGFMTRAINSIAIDSNSTSLQIALLPGYYDDFVLDFNWEEFGDASTGRFTRGNPIGTDFNGTLINPGVDLNIDFGEACYMTGNGGGNAGTDDVDDGTTTLISPYFDATSYKAPQMSFYRWFANAGGSGTPDDALIIAIDNNQTIDTLKVINSSDPYLSQWQFESFLLPQVTTVSDSMRLIIQTADQQFSGHLVEAAIDVFTITDTGKVVVAPVAAFTQNQDTICAGNTVQFFNNAQNTPTSFSWLFPGGTPAQSTAENPVITYDSAGVYDVTFIAINAGGKDTLTKVAQITVLDGPVFEISATNVSCFGLSDGAATVNVLTGQPPYDYSWSNGSAGNPVAGLGIGFYTVTVTNGNGCTASTLFQIDQPARISVNTSSTPDTNGQQVGTARASVIGGIKPYTYLWDDPMAQDSQVAINLAAGVYQVEITDKNGCIEGATIEVERVNRTGLPQWDGEIAVYPNPANNQLFIQYHLPEAAEIHMLLLSATGQQVWQATHSGIQYKQQVPIATVPAGIYWLRFTSDKASTLRKIVIVK